MKKEDEEVKKVIFCIPTIKKPYQCCLDSLAASLPLIVEAGWQEGMVSEIGSPYISHARAKMLRKALDAKATVIVFIDHDLSWKPQDLLTLIEAKGDVVAGTYRYKYEPEEYMGALLPDINGMPQVREDGGLRGFCAPAGFLKITNKAVARFMIAHPELCFGPRYSMTVDLFNHGCHEGVWYGEDYAFCRRWLGFGGELVIMPDLDINHHTPTEEFKGNFHQYLLRQKGGSNDPDRVPDGN